MKTDVYFQYAPLVDILQARGWDVTAYDEILGRREDVLGVWTIGIDRGGRVRFTATRPTSMPQGRRLQRNYRRYRLLLEAHSILTVTTKLRAAEELPAVLNQLIAFAMGRD